MAKVARPSLKTLAIKVVARDLLKNTKKGTNFPLKTLEKNGKGKIIIHQILWVP